MESANVFIYEVDQTGSQPVTLGATTGLVGLTGKGPAFRPTTISSLSQFKTYFGDSEDSTYLYFASKYFLENNAPITIVRPLGVNDTDTSFHAGFNDVDYIKAIALSGSTGPEQFLSLIWCKSDVTITESDDSDVHTIYEDIALTINRSVSGSSDVEIFSGAVNFNPASTNYINKKLNTDLLKFHEDGYVLVQTNNFAWYPTTGGVAPLSSSSALTFLVTNVTTTSSAAPDFTADYTTPNTPWIVSQLYGAPATEGSQPTSYDLFRFKSISDGEWANNGIKVFISNIRKSTSADSPYGTFDVVVRDYFDTDGAPTILERFSGCTLDPKNKNYILSKIGDKYTTYDFDNGKLLTYGDYDNKSSYIYVELSNEVANTPKDALPWGYRNMPLVGANLVGKIPTPYMTQAQKIKGLYNSKKCWGVCFEQPNSDVLSSVTYKHEDSLDSLFQYVPANVTQLEAANNSVMFSLNALKLPSGNNAKGTDRLRPTDIKKLTFDASIITSDDSGDWASVEAIEGTTAACFGMPFFGGFDALNPFFKSASYAFTTETAGELYSFTGMFANKTYLPEYIPEEDQEWEDAVVDQPAANDEDSNMMVYAFNKCIDIITNPDHINIQTLACPGITNNLINSYGIEKCSERGDTLFVVEICENGTTCDEAISERDSIGYDTSYAASYFPYYKIKDEEKSVYRWIPPSIAALKAYSITDKVSFPWYAAAGILRGNLPEAVDVAYKSNATERTNLINAFINPIASFPSEGHVIWGQNTMYSKTSYLQMLHVRRLVIYAKKAVKSAVLNLVFEPNTQRTWDRFTRSVTPILSYIQSFQGLANFKVVCDSTVNTQDLIDQRKMVGQIIIQPIPDAEIIEIPFIITNNSVVFSD